MTRRFTKLFLEGFFMGLASFRFLRFAVCGLRFAVCHKLCKDNVVTLMRMVKTKRYRHPAADDTIVFVRIIRNLLKTRIRSDTYSI